MELHTTLRPRSSAILAKILSSDKAPSPARVLSRASARSFWRWLKADLKLFRELHTVRDGRDPSRVKIPLTVILASVLAMYWFQLPSLNALEDQLAHGLWLRRQLAQLGYGESFSSEAVAKALAQVDPDDLRAVLYRLGRRSLKGWGAGRYLESHIGRRLTLIGQHHLAAKAIVTIDGHHLFGTTSQERCCAACRTTTKTINGERITVYYHMTLVAQMLGAHPAMMLDFEPMRPGENEKTAVKRLLPRLKAAYGDRIGIVVADAMYDSEPFRRQVADAGWRSIVVHKDNNHSFAVEAQAALDERDPARRRPDWKHHPDPWLAYRVWEQAAGGRRLVEVRRTTKERRGSEEHTWKSQALTDLPAARANAVAVGIILEERWEIENKGFKQLVEDWKLDRAYVHADRPKAAWAFVALALLAYNAFHTFVYRHLGLDPAAPARSLQAIRRDLLHTVAGLAARGPPRDHQP